MIILATLLVRIEYINFNGLPIIFNKGEVILVHTEAHIARCGNEHFDIEQHEYEQVASLEENLCPPSQVAER